MERYHLIHPYAKLMRGLDPGDGCYRTLAPSAFNPTAFTLNA